MDYEDIRPDTVEAIEELALWVGRIAFKSVALEFQLRRLFAGLVGDGPGQRLAPIQVGALIGSCRAMLVDDEDAERRRHCTAALDKATAANAWRNRAVHDMWVGREGGEPGERLLRLRFRRGLQLDVAGAESLAEVQEAWTRLARSEVRVMAVASMYQSDFPASEDDRKSVQAVLDGRFRVLIPYGYKVDED